MVLLRWLGILGLWGGSLAMLGRPLEEPSRRSAPDVQPSRKEGVGARRPPQSRAGRSQPRARRPRTAPFVIQVEAITIPWTFETWHGAFR
jgi:hypothetical protein